MTTEFRGDRQHRTKEKYAVATFCQTMSVRDGYFGGAAVDLRIIVNDDNIHWGGDLGPNECYTLIWALQWIPRRRVIPIGSVF